MKARIKRRLLCWAATLAVAASFAPGPALAEPPPDDGWTASALNPSRPAPDGFLSPTLKGDWRFRIAANIWAPNVVQIDVSTSRGNGGLDENLKWLLKSMSYYVPVDFAVRKGSFGVYLHTLFLGLKGDTELLEGSHLLGPIELDWNVPLFLIDAGVSYELGRWRLWDSAKAPELTIEPTFGVRVVQLPAHISVLDREITKDLNSQVPVVGLRTVIDFTEHWNLELAGDYGGWGADSNRQTWQGVALIGYRWPGWGAHWNFQAGYRAMRLFRYQRGDVEIGMRARGFDFILGVEF
ncbi:MAG: hypothetical protein JRG80_19005 [Deltaproteobacteria bacterium]|nr:hypothetical protein [Deltaproteobacteria bacterium]